MNRLPLLAGFAAVLLAGIASGWFLRGFRDSQIRENRSPATATHEAAAGAPPVLKTGATSELAAGHAQPSPSAAPVEALNMDLLAAIQDKSFAMEFRGNGRDRLRMIGINHEAQPVRLSIPAGQSFESASGSVVLERARVIEFQPGETRLEDLATLAAASTNHLADRTFSPSATPQPKLEPLLEYLADHPEVSVSAAQTAALAIMENLPANAFAKFAEAGNDLPNQWDTTAFKVETADIVEALILLRQMGLPDEQLAITVDPQTKIEAMIDPLAHALAMRYYDIKPEAEWTYWKHELLEGDPSTRHYALHGISRYFPDVAIQMLPRWVREPRTNQIFRVVAIQALAETERPEAVPLLRALELEMGAQTELGRTAGESASYLENSLNKSAPGGKKAIVFRISKEPASL